MSPQRAKSPPCSWRFDLIAITGATGLIGGHLARRALRNGVGVRFLFRSPSTSVNELENLGAEGVRGDLLEAAAIASLVDGCDALVHCAAATTSGSAAEVRNVNLEGTRAVAQVCRQCGCRLVHVATPSVLLDSTHQLGVDESRQPPHKPIGLYAQTKLEAEQIVQQKCEDWVIVRPKAVFGPGDRTLLPELLRVIRSRRVAQIGGEPVYIGLTHAENVAQALLAAATNKQANGIYHVDNGEAVDLWEFVTALRAALTGHKGPLRRLPYGPLACTARVTDALTVGHSRRKGLHQYRVALLGRSQTLDCSRARRELGYQPELAVRDGVLQTLRESLTDLELRRFEAAWRHGL